MHACTTRLGLAFGRLNQNLGALQGRLSAEDVTRISEIVPAGAAAGNRYPDMAGVYR
jgi:hypothetical protein